MKEPMVMMAIEHYAPYRWVQAPIAALALWLIISPFTLGYTSRALVWSDLVSGAVTLGLTQDGAEGTLPFVAGCQGAAACCEGM